MKRLRRFAGYYDEEKDEWIEEFEPGHDKDNRKIAVVYVNGEFIETKTHGQAIDKYLQENGYGKLNNPWFRPNLYGDELPMPAMQQDKNMVDKYITEMAIGHIVDSESAIYLDQDYIKGMTLQQAAQIFKSHYPGFKIYNDNDYDSEKQRYKRLAYHTNKQTKQWIDDRVKILQKNNPDMSNDVAYGIAWKQFKKKHPSWESKSSKKTAEFVDGYEWENSFGEKIQVEIYINPTMKEISNCIKNEYKAIRGIIDNGVEYCWRGDVLHEQVKGVNINEFRFAYENNSGFSGWTFDAHHKYSLLELCILIKDNANRLSKYGNLKEEIFICGTTNSRGDEYDIRTYDQILDYIESNESKKTARLLKKSEYLHCHNCNFDNGDYMYDNDGNLLSWVPDPKTKKFKNLSKSQIYKNPKEYEEKNPEHICPICGKKELDVD